MVREARMLTITLRKGCYATKRDDSKEVNTADFCDYPTPALPYGVIAETSSNTLPPIEEAYEYLKAKGYSQEHIIDKLVNWYLPIKFFKVGAYSKLPLVIGFIGHRGAGKTISAVQTIACDYMLRGYACYSNVHIAFDVRYRDCIKHYESFPLNKASLWELGTEKGYRGCVVFVDEINMETAESTRFMSNANLQFSYALQQIRKRSISVIWTCQGWMWVDARTRWQTDFVINCQDAFMLHRGGAAGVGDACKWTAYDLSGLTGTFGLDFEQSHHYITDFEVWSGIIWSRPWWGAYDTNLLQGKANYRKEFNQNSTEISNAVYSLPEPSIKPEVKIADDIAASGLTEIMADDIWQVNNIGDDKAAQTKIGMELHKRGFIARRTTGNKTFYERCVNG